jgi:cob(I)alamin adenosyltransferase
MFFTGKGDHGATTLFNCDEKIVKTALVVEALGALDEINSLLGLCKVHVAREGVVIPSGVALADVITDIQHTLFVIQSELAQAKSYTVSEQKLHDLEQILRDIESHIPPITTFILPGGTECATWCDMARAYARKTERKVLQVVQEGKVKLGTHSCAYLNRLSSVLYAFARWVNFKAGVSEIPPHYDQK